MLYLEGCPKPVDLALLIDASGKSFATDLTSRRYKQAFVWNDLGRVSQKRKGDNKKISQKNNLAAKKSSRRMPIVLGTYT